jgi:ubiquinone/menaquinone biosynthesis C-methylase UbiE
LAHVSPEERVLEVAVGPGAVAVRLSQQVGESGRAVGVDFAPRMLRVARRRSPHAILVRADALSLPFGEGAFDLVWSSYFLDLVPTAELTPLLRELRRVLRPGGRLLLVSLSQKSEAPTWWERFYYAGCAYPARVSVVSHFPSTPSSHNRQCDIRRTTSPV